MSENVSEFFSKEKVQKFTNGAKSLADRSKKRAATIGMVLATAFTIGSCGMHASAHIDEGKIDVKTDTVETVDYSKPTTAYAITEKGDTLCSYQAIPQDSASFAKLQGLVNSATKSKTGCSIIESISKQGTTLTIEKADSTVVGYFDPSSNAIVLNPIFGDATLQSCLAHEGKHSVQSHDFNKDADAFYSFKANTIITRAMEADAVANQTKFSYEMMQAGDSLAWKDLEKSHGGITKTFEENAKKYGVDAKETMKETMLAWYDDIPYSSLYDQSMVDFYAAASKKLDKDVLPYAFTQSVNADSVVVNICKVNGESYAGTDGSILTQPRTLSLTPEMFVATQAIAAYQQEKCGKCDTSSNDMYVVYEGKPTSITYTVLLDSMSKEKGAESKVSTNEEISAQTQKQLKKLEVAENKSSTISFAKAALNKKYSRG
ncbi:MAG: hypothetical protein MJ247_01830 [Alphaproteobacteria bacterium]|nr:hypothetical protein [Alphaproteobacteria bacterium]